MNENITCEILNYNDANTVIKMVDSIKKYNLLDYILIVDNGSTDSSYSTLKEKYRSNIKVKVISSGENGGYGYGNNYGINYAYNILHSKYVIVSNPDVFFSEKLIMKLKAVLKHKKIALASGTQKVNGKIVEHRAWKVPTPFQWAFYDLKLGRILGIGKKFYYPASYYNGSISQVECVVGAMFMIDAEKFLNVGGYDEEMFLFCEETTIGQKLKKAGYKSMLLNNEYYDHLHSVSINKSIPSAINRLKILHESELIFDRKYQKSSFLQLKIISYIFKLSILELKLKSIFLS